MAAFSLQGKVCVVTGGASGIGEALCIHFASNGAKKVVVVDMNVAAAQLLAEKIGGTYIFFSRALSVAWSMLQAE